jgi:hypothetical protein
MAELIATLHMSLLENKPELRVTVEPLISCI